MISVSWTPNSDGGSPITGYVVTATGPDGIWTCAPASVADTSCMLSGLPGGQSYFVYVQAINAAGTSSASIGQFVTTDVAPPSAPTDVSGDPGDGEVTVTWAASASTGGSPITGYTVTSFPDGETCETTGALTCTVPWLTNGRAYTFTVTATNAIGTSPESVDSAPVTPDGATTVAVDCEADIDTSSDSAEECSALLPDDSSTTSGGSSSSNSRGGALPTTGGNATMPLVVLAIAFLAIGLMLTRVRRRA